MFKKIFKFLLVIFSVGVISGCSNSSAATQTKSSTNKITVVYQLKNNKKTFATKKVKLAKHSTVLKGLKKAWPVQQKKGFVTQIDHRSQKPKQSKYWLYTVNGKQVNKGAASQKLTNHDKVVFDLQVAK
ncbi:DUF4430 domain-containing protein [Liquorilactobacillus vini]|uniref:Transcobalamin-like C-terminal domain-containing protein n=1 Tax=Liquorilactobacillus vini DSM 20605 TaxID=1133569 RepID=A0A0R2CD42_9LACO|nr:DUF4430 domain-containing protein [Liquorilactobacillus vini]KRM86299.1 hypothetical protein FD21_GL001678 [Liquorilactobacillus vini DSM 20605]